MERNHAETVYYDAEGHALPYVVVIAVKDIAEGQEMLVNYGDNYFVQMLLADDGGGECLSGSKANLLRVGKHQCMDEQWKAWVQGLV
eukprot:1160877-Pelagomonas_calceolata.AAC.9